MGAHRRPAADPRLLIVGYHFPPRGGVAAQRLVKFARYLPEFGWQPLVLTPEAAGEPLLDPALEAEVQGVEVVRTRMLSLDPAHGWARERGLGGRRRPAEGPRRSLRAQVRWLLLPDDKVGWVPWALRAGRGLIARRAIRALLSSSPPATSHLIALRLHRATGLPWVADFRDPWTGHPNLYFPTRWHRRWCVGLERAIVREATAVTVTTPAIAADLAARHATGPDRYVVLPNGYDPDDFAGLVRRPHDRLTLLYAGTFQAYTPGPRRTPVYLLDAVAALLRRHPALRGRLRLVLLGPDPAHLQPLVAARGLADVVETPGFASHRASVQAMVEADVLLLLQGDNETRTIAAKTFEYLAARRPILAALPEGENAAFCRSVGVEPVLPPRDVAGMERLLHRVALAGADALPVPPPEVVRRYDRRLVTGRLAALLGEAAAFDRPPALAAGAARA